MHQQATGTPTPSRAPAGLPWFVAGSWLLVISTAWPLCAQEAQEDAPGDTPAFNVSEGARLYRQGVFNREKVTLGESVLLLTKALDANPDDTAALLFRALAQGELGYLEGAQRLRGARSLGDIEQALSIREAPEKRTELEDELADIKLRLEDETLPPAEVVILAERERDLTGLLDNLQLFAEVSTDDLEHDRRNALDADREGANQERSAYRVMHTDLDRLIGLLDEPELVVRLLDVVALTKHARLNSEEARSVEKNEITAGQASASASDLHTDAERLLEKAAAMLEPVADDPSLGEKGARARFFLGIVRWRQAAPHSGRKYDYGQLQQAREIMESIADDESVTDRWRSFASLYLGLILPIQAKRERNDTARNALFDEAEQRLLQATELVTDTTDPASPKVRDRSAVPALVFEHRRVIDEERTKPALGRGDRLEDIELTIYAGAHRDSNVVLLGGRTDLPRDISRSADFGFSSGVTLGYTRDLTDRLTLGVEARVTQLWHADVDEFDEQGYGGSVALRYEAMPKAPDSSFGPIYLRLQYDYNYTLLGRKGFLSQHTITPDVQLIWLNGKAVSDLYFRYEIRDYFEPLFDKRFERSGEYLALGFAQRFDVLDMSKVWRDAGIEPWGHRNDEHFKQRDPDFPARYLRPSFGFEYSWDQTDGDEFDLKAFLFAFGLGVPLPYGIDLNVAASFEWEQYQRGSLVDFHRRQRRDFIQTYELALSRTFILKAGRPENRYTNEIDHVLMTLRAHAAWTGDDSNGVDRLGQSIFEYDRWVYGLSVAFTFN